MAHESVCDSGAAQDEGDARDKAQADRNRPSGLTPAGRFTFLFCIGEVQIQGGRDANATAAVRTLAAVHGATFFVAFVDFSIVKTATLNAKLILIAVRAGRSLANSRENLHGTLIAARRATAANAVGFLRTGVGLSVADGGAKLQRHALSAITNFARLTF